MTSRTRRAVLRIIGALFEGAVFVRDQSQRVAARLPGSYGDGGYGSGGSGSSSSSTPSPSPSPTATETASRSTETSSPTATKTESPSPVTPRGPPTTVPSNESARDRDREEDGFDLDVIGDEESEGRGEDRGIGQRVREWVARRFEDDEAEDGEDEPGVVDRVSAWVARRFEDDDDEEDERSLFDRLRGMFD